MAEEKKDVSGKSRLVELLLCLFFGWAGGHRFYVNKIGTGLLMLFTMGGFGMWWLADLVMISLGAYTFTDMMLAEERATIMAGRQQQAKAAVASGVEYLKDYLSLTADDQASVGGHWDNPSYFKDVPVSATDPTGVRFAIVSVDCRNHPITRGIGVSTADHIHMVLTSPRRA